VPAILPLALAAALLATGLGLRGRPERGRAAMPVLALAAGAGLLALRVMLGPGPAAPALLPSNAGPWHAVVDSVGAPREGRQTARLTLEGGSGPVVVAATLPSYPVVRAGAVVEVTGHLRPPPDDDPYGEYLRRTGAAGSLQARELRVVTDPAAGSLQGLRDGAGDALRLALPEPEAGLAAGILIGLKERVDRTLAADFATAGASHVVAISGWNIAIVAGLVGAVLRGRPRRLVSIGVAVTVVAYVIAAGGSASVVRAALMAGVVLFARESGRAGRAPAALAVAALILLLVEPYLIGDAGFRLSVMATAGLLAWATPLGSWLGTHTGGRLPGWLTEGLGISLAAQAATLPDVLLTFGRLSLVSPVVNLAVVPLVPPAMAAGVVALAGGLVAMAGAPAIVATLAGLPGWLLLHVIVVVVRSAAGLPLAALAVPPEITPLLAAGAAGAVLAVGSPGVRRWVAGGLARRRGRLAAPGPRRPRAAPPPRRRSLLERSLLAAAAVVAVISTMALGDAASRATRLVMLDVGQGDAILLESRTGRRVLVDGGPDPERLLMELDARVPPWDRHVDVLVLTHPHEDHVAGLVRVVERYRVGRVFEPGMRGTSPGWEAWDALLRVRSDIPRQTLAAGGRIDVAEFRLDVIWPEPGTVPREPGSTGRAVNDASIVLLGSAAGRTFLLTGDAEEDVDPALVARGLPHLDVLKVAHHGSATATSTELIAATTPTVALISASEDNDYGHPAPATLARLADAGVQIHRTDLEGTLVVGLSRERLTLTTERSGDTGARAPRTGARAPRTGYDSTHDLPGAPRGRLTAALPGPSRVVPPPRVRRGGRRGLAGGRDQRPRGARGRGRRGGSSTAARRRQAALGGTGRRDPPRGGIGGVPRCPRPAGAGGAGAGPPGHPPRRRRRPGAPAGSPARGPDRRLRGQACGPAAPDDGAAVRCLAAALPGHTSRGAGRRGGSPSTQAGGLDGRGGHAYPGQGRGARARGVPGCRG
jgi:competence protein ComEC